MSAPTLIVVDDDPALRHAIAFAFGLEGFEVRAFASAGEMLEAGALPDRACLVLDYRLPDLDGLALLDRLQAKGDDRPALLITTHPSEDVRRRAAARGVPIVEKPLMGDSLTNAVAALLQT